MIAEKETIGQVIKTGWTFQPSIYESLHVFPESFKELGINGEYAFVQ